MNMKPHHRKKYLGVVGLTMSMVCLLFMTSAVEAAPSRASGSPSTSATTPTAAQQQRLQNIIAKGNQEITRRITNLQQVSSVINAAATKLTQADQSALSTEVSTEIAGLQSLKTQLDAATSISAALPFAQQIYTEYRVYALVLPKIQLVRVADDEQVTEGKLSSFAQKLQTRLTQAQQGGKNVASLQNDLADMTAKTTAAQGISSEIESSVIALQPTDYNANHSILNGDMEQLKTALADEQAARSDAQAIVSGLA